MTTMVETYMLNFLYIFIQKNNSKALFLDELFSIKQISKARVAKALIEALV